MASAPALEPREGESQSLNTQGRAWPWGPGGQSAASGSSDTSPSPSSGLTRGNTQGLGGEAVQAPQSALLQPVVFAQIIGALVLGVAPIARAALEGQQYPIFASGGCWMGGTRRRDLEGIPLSSAILRGLYGVWGSVCTSSYETPFFHAASLLAFFRALRISQLVILAKGDRKGFKA